MEPYKIESFQDLFHLELTKFTKSLTFLFLKQFSLNI